MKNIKWSHSSLSTIIDCPMNYYLSKIQGIEPIDKKAALYIGSLFHSGVEHNTEDLTEFVDDKDNYTKEQLLAEAMVHGFLKHKEEIWDKVLTDYNGNKLKLISEENEVYITGKLKSIKYKDFVHDFIGIIDKLLLVEDENGNKYFIILDYKTSSKEPDWDNYLEQLYRYIFLIKCEFPEIPILKIGIINVIKSSIRQKKTENELQFLNRLKLEYDVASEEYINYHEYDRSKLDEVMINEYITNLSKTCDVAKNIVDNNMWFINYATITNIYGKTTFYDIYKKTPDCQMLYKIKDNVYIDGELKEYRECRVIDMETIEKNDILNHYKEYENQINHYIDCSNFTFDSFHKMLKEMFICDDYLLELYKDTYLYLKGEIS